LRRIHFPALFCAIGILTGCSGTRTQEPAAHHGNAYDESVVMNPNGTLANAFVYIKSGLEGKRFEVPAAAAVIDQRGCWFHPRVLGIQRPAKRYR
jgi:hypothetical protein